MTHEKHVIFSNYGKSNANINRSFIKRNVTRPMLTQLNMNNNDINNVDNLSSNGTVTTNELVVNGESYFNNNMNIGIGEQNMVTIDATNGNIIIAGDVYVYGTVTSTTSLNVENRIIIIGQ